MSNRRIITLIYLLVVLNIMDASVTIMSIGAGIAEEVNPIMAFFLEKHVLWFILVKFIAVFGACYVFWTLRAEKMAQIGLKISVGAYLLLLSYFCIELL